MSKKERAMKKKEKDQQRPRSNKQLTKTNVLRATSKKFHLNFTEIL